MRRAAIVSALGALAAGLAMWWSFQPGPGEPPRKQLATYVQPGLCAGCHAGIWETYRRTGMGRSFARTSPEVMQAGRYYHQPSNRHYTMEVRDGRYFQRRYQTALGGVPENSVELEAHYVLGSGNHSRSYLHRTASGKLILLPLAWYSEGIGTWAMNPGYDRPDHKGFRRAITYDCMFCHNGYPSGLEAAKVGDDAVFSSGLPEGIGCQRCHGPGSAHVEAAGERKPAEQIRASIVNPKRLSRDRNLEVCMQCHLETTSRPLPYSMIRFDRGFFSYLPGEPLSDYMLHFDHAPGSGNDGKFEIAHAAYRLRKSECFRRSDSMTCTTCHNPHDVPRGAQAVVHYRSVCRSCHGDSHRSGEDCAVCHMPKRRTEDVIHVVMTDHLIQRRAPANLLAPLEERHEAPETAYHGEVTPYYPSHQVEELYLAAAQVTEGSNLTAGAPRLEAAISRYKPAEAMFYFELAEALWKTGERARAVTYYNEALRRDRALLPAIRNLGAALIEMEDLERAASVLASAPGDAASLSNLGDVYRKQSNLQAAAQTYRLAISLDPGLPEAHHGLAQTLLAAGDSAAAFAAFQEAIRHRPDYAEAHFNWGTALGQQGDFAGAEKRLLLAVAANPKLAGACNNLGLIAIARGDVTTAERWFRRALQVDPADEQAKANLARVLASKGR